jgi:hypothetical protein
MNLTIQMMIQKIELILQEIVYFLTRRLANRLAFFTIGALLNVKRDRHEVYTL